MEMENSIFLKDFLYNSIEFQSVTRADIDWFEIKVGELTFFAYPLAMKVCKPLVANW